MKVLLTNFHYKKEFKTVSDYLIAVLFYFVLFIPSVIYWVIVKTRNYLYKKNKIKTFQSRVYTISVGNLTTGGTGKTPITAEIANYLCNQGEHVAILSRGYGGQLPNKKVNVISDFENVNYDALMAGDEPYWLATNCSGSAVLTCASRVKSAQYAQNELGATRLLLDDGYQHQKLKRDLNILVVDSEKQFSNGFVLPLGALREPITEIIRADKIIIVNKNLDDRQARLFSIYLRKNYKKDVVICSMQPDIVYNIKTNELIDEKLPVIAFSAIGQPEQFYNFLSRYDVLETKNYSDHHLYTIDDVNELQNLMKKHGAKAMITTEKDAVKLQEIVSEDIGIYALKLKPSMDLKKLLES